MAHYHFRSPALSWTSLSENTEEILSGWKRQFGRASSASESTSTNDRADEDQRYLRPHTSFGSPHHGPSSPHWSSSDVSGSTSRSYNESRPSGVEVTFEATLCQGLTVFIAIVLLVITTVLASQVMMDGSQETSSPTYGRPDVSHVPIQELRHFDAAITAPRSVEPRALSTLSEKDERLVNERTPVTSESSAVETLLTSVTTEDLGLAVMASDQIPSSNHRRTERHICDSVFYTYCSRALPEFHYDLRTRQCRRTDELDDVKMQLCNHGPNRFMSKAACLKSCVHGLTPAERCFDTPIFSACERDDVIAKLWYFNGHTCSAWTFPQGKCPGKETDMFATFAECLERCINRPGGQPLCQPVAPVVSNARACDLWELRYPFFADSVEQHVRCLAAPVASFVRHRCLVGTNRFATKAACERACITHSSEDEALVP